MKLESIVIMKSWQQPGEYTAQVKYSGSRGTVEVKLTPTLTDKVLQVIAEDVVAASREVARDLTAACIEAQDVAGRLGMSDLEGRN